MLRFVLLFILATVVARAVSRLMNGVRETIAGPRPAPGAPTQGVQMVRDPICGTFIVPDRAVMLMVGAERLYFCSEECRQKYHGVASGFSGKKYTDVASGFSRKKFSS